MAPAQILSGFATSFLVATICCLSVSEAERDCLWQFESRPPSPAPIIFCDPFHNDSRLTLPCLITGPSEVELNWYFNNGTILLMNSTKHRLVKSVVYHDNNTVTVSLNVTLSNLEEAVDQGIYSCTAIVKETGNILSPSVHFLLSKQSNALFSGPCSSIPFESPDPFVCAGEVFPPSNALVSPLSSSVHLLLQSDLRPILTTPIILPSISNTLLLTKPSTHQTSPLTTGTTHRSLLQTQVPNSVLTSVIGVHSYASVNIQSSSSLPSTIQSRDSGVGSKGVTPPINTWFYLLAAIIVLSFLMIILVLILVILCVVKRNSSRRVVHFPSAQEEITIQKTGRQPSDPLPKIRNIVTTEGAQNTKCYDVSTLPQHAVTFVQSAPDSGTSGFATSLQHLSFNLGPSFESNNTLYDEIGPPEGSGLPDIRRGSHDYVNTWQFTVSDSTSAASGSALPQDTSSSNENLSCGIEMPIQLANPDCQNGKIVANDVVVGTDGTMSTADLWFGNNSPIVISQGPTHHPWEEGDNTDDGTFGNRNVFLFSPVESSQTSGSMFFMEELPEDFSEDESEDDTSLNDSTTDASCIVVRESHFPNSLPVNTLNGQSFELSSTSPVRSSKPLLSGLDSSESSTSSSTELVEHSLSCREPLPMTCTGTQESPSSSNKSLGEEREGDNSRSSSSSSGCTDISKYSGDYDRDPAYMRLLLSRMGVGLTTPGTLNDEFSGGEVRADSGMESLYTEATASLPPAVTNSMGNITSTGSNGQYKSLNNLTLEPDSLYMHTCGRQ